MNSSEIRNRARINLKDRWGEGVLITLVFLAINWAFNFVVGMIRFISSLASLEMVSFLISLASYVILIPMSFGLVTTFIKLKRKQELNYIDFIKDGFSNFNKVWSVFGNTLLKMILPIICLVLSIALIVIGTFVLATTSNFIFIFLIPLGLSCYLASLVFCIIKGFSYSLVYYILNDNPDMTGKEIVEESSKLMNGNKFKYFCLNLSFIGWNILATLTLGVGYLWLTPYMNISLVVFYENLIGKTDDIIENVEFETKVEETKEITEPSEDEDKVEEIAEKIVTENVEEEKIIEEVPEETSAEKNDDNKETE